MVSSKCFALNAVNPEESCEFKYSLETWGFAACPFLGYWNCTHQQLILQLGALKAKPTKRNHNRYWSSLFSCYFLCLFLAVVLLYAKSISFGNRLKLLILCIISSNSKAGASSVKKLAGTAISSWGFCSARSSGTKTAKPGGLRSSICGARMWFALKRKVAAESKFEQSVLYGSDDHSCLRLWREREIESEAVMHTQWVSLVNSQLPVSTTEETQGSCLSTSAAVSNVWQLEVLGLWKNS